MPRATPTSTRGFRRALLVTLAVLALACAGLGAASILQGPKISAATLDVAAATTAPGQQLRLVLDEAVAPIRARDVRVRPAVPVTVSTQGDVVLLRLGAALRNATAYSLEVRGVVSTRGGPAATLHHGFTTPAVALDLLQRGPATDGTSADHILRVTPTATRELFAGPGIQAFAPVGGALAVAQDDSSGASVLRIVQPDSPNAETLALPAAGRVDAITTLGSTVLFTFTSTVADPVPEFDRTLFRVDLEGTHRVEPVAGLDGTPLRVDDWRALPGTTAMILHGVDATILRYDPGAKPTLTPSGLVDELGGVSPDQSRIGVTTHDVSGVLALSSGDTEALTTPASLGAGAHLDLPLPLDARRTFVRIATPGSGAFAYTMAELDGSAARTVFAPVGTSPRIVDGALSANGQYLLLEVDPDQLHSSLDGSFVDPQPAAITFVAVDVATGRPIIQTPGFAAVPVRP
jgi:hypothetical protein